MTPPVLRYFDIRARAEPLRLLLVDAGVDFVDERVPYDDNWKTKGTLEQPFRLLPTLDVTEVDGKTFRLPETIPITEYLEETYGVGQQQRTPLEKAKVNAIRDAALSFVDGHWDFFWADNFPDLDAMQRREARNIKWLGLASSYLSQFPRTLLFTEPVEGKGVTSLTGAAVWLYEALHIIETQFPGLLAEVQPDLAEIHKAIISRPRIAAYLAAGKETKIVTLSSVETEERKSAAREVWVKSKQKPAA